MKINNHISEDDEEDKEGVEYSPDIVVIQDNSTKVKSTFSKQNNGSPKATQSPSRKSQNREDKIVQFIQNIIKKSYLTNRNSSLLRNKSHGTVLYRDVHEEEEDGDEEEKLEDRFNQNTQNNFSDTESEDKIEDEPKINLLHWNRKSLNPFITKTDRIMIPLKHLERKSINERDLSLAFYEYMSKYHKDLFENLRASYKEWREGVEKFNKMDEQVSLSAVSRKTYGKQLGGMLADSFQLIRNQSTKDPIYDQFETDYEDVYYQDFTAEDDELRDFLNDESDGDSDDFDFDIDSDFGDWL